MLLLVGITAPPLLHVRKYDENGHEYHVEGCIITGVPKGFLSPLNTKPSTPIEGGRVEEHLPLTYNNQQNEEERKGGQIVVSMNFPN